MKTIILLLFCAAVLWSKVGASQPIPPQSIEDSVIGWKKIYHFKGINKPMKAGDKYYSSAQLAIIDTLANWMQASYMPKGGLGDIKKFVSGELDAYHQYEAGMPPSYGATARTYIELRYNSQHKIEPVTGSSVYWTVAANKIPGNWPIMDLCSPTQYYFTLPTAETEVSDERIKKSIDISKTPSTQRYITFWVENMGFGGGKENVILCKDNKSPFIKITKGEYLQAMEAALARYYEREKKKIAEAEQGDQKRIDQSVKFLDERMARLTSGLKMNKDKYKNRLEEPALTSSQPDIMDMDSGRDLFTNGYLTDSESTSTRYFVYKVDPAVAELCKKDQPQWILVSWDYYPSALPFEKQQHESIINNFNFEYVYNFFFDPQKVKGQPYKPLRSPFYKEATIVTEKSAKATKTALDKNLHFFEDFSTTSVGKKPNGWSARTNEIAFCEVTTVDGVPDKWVSLAGSSIKSNELKPLPANFTLSYDVFVPENFTWGAKGLVLLLSREKTPGVSEYFIRLKLRPGSGGANGEAEFETKCPPAYANGTKWYVATGFSNNKKINRVNVEIKKSGELLQLLIDKNVIAEYAKGIPTDLSFNALSFDMGRSDSEVEKYYISNIKITKD